jgi:hypothetical protein
MYFCKSLAGKKLAFKRCEKLDEKRRVEDVGLLETLNEKSKEKKCCKKLPI